MQLLQGPQALDALHALGTEGVLAVVTDPRAKNGGTSELWALGTCAHAIVIDAARTPALGARLAAYPVTAAWDAKAAHRSALSTFGHGPGRWACAKLSAQLLAGGREQPTDRVALARAAGVTLPRSLDSVEALCAEARALAQVLAAQGRALQEARMQRVSRIESRAVAAVAEMEHRGMPFNADAWRTVAADIQGQYQALRAQILAHWGAPADTDIGHDQALLQVLRSRGVQVENAKRSTLGALPAPLGPWLETFKTLEKRMRAYGTGYLEHVGADGRLHATFEQIGASTGRMACHAPNLQAMVKGTAHRSCFKPSPQRRLVVADYAACELRILAQLSRDPVFVEAFARNEDVHARVAGTIFGEPVSKTHKPHLRHIAKTVSFGLVYGMGAAGLARTLNIPVAEARALVERYFATFPRIRSALEALSATARARGSAQTGSGRRLYLDGPAFADDPGLQARVAKNMPIQGTNADIIKLALAQLREALADFEATHVVHCIHDEVVVECPASAAAAVRATVVDIMVTAGEPLLPDVPLAVEARTLRHWGDE